MSLKTVFQSIANANGWFYYYGREDYQNLTELSGNTVGLFVEPIGEEPRFNEYGVRESTTFSGRFLLAVNSDVDEDYQDKFEQHIEPLKANLLPLVSHALSCKSFSIIQWRILEGINLFDQNVDGVLVSYNMTLLD